MVFLRPMVIRDNATSDALMMDRYEAIRALQQNTQPAPSTVMRAVSDAPVLPPLQGAAPGAGAQRAPLAPLVPNPPAPARATPAATSSELYSPQ